MAGSKNLRLVFESICHTYFIQDQNSRSDLAGSEVFLNLGIGDVLSRHNRYLEDHFV